MSTPDTVAIIIVNFNTEQQLLYCLEAVAKQTRPAEQVWVIDNASSQGFDKYSWQKCYPSFNFITSPKNLGFAGANNLGAELAGPCEWLCLLNPDAYPEPDWLEKMLAAAKELPHATHLASKMILAHSPGILDGAGDVYHTSGAAWRRGRGLSVATFTQQEPVLAAGAAAAFYRRWAWQLVGGFDESYFCYYEDVDLSLRLLLAGGTGYYIPGAMVHHEGGASVKGGNSFSTYYGHRNLMLTFFKNMPWPLLVLYLPQHLAVNIGAVLWCSFRGEGRVAWRAKLDALKLLPSIWVRRREVQKSRRMSSLSLRRAMARGLRPLLNHWLRGPKYRNSSISPKI